MGPASSQPQQPFEAEKSFPSVYMVVMIWQFSLPHFGHRIKLSPFQQARCVCFSDFRMIRNSYA